MNNRIVFNRSSLFVGAIAPLLHEEFSPGVHERSQIVQFGIQAPKETELSPRARLRAISERENAGHRLGAAQRFP